MSASLDLRLNEYCSVASLLGLLSGQVEEPNKKYCRDWSLAMGDMLATAFLRRRNKRRRRPSA